MKAPFIICPAYRGQPYSRPWGEKRHSYADEPTEGAGLPAFRLRFRLGEQPQRAVLEAASLGLFDLYCNGERVGLPTKEGTVYDELKGGAPDYRVRAESDFYDLMPYLAAENTLVFVVSPGYYAGRISFGVYGLRTPAIAAELTLTFADGKTQVITTDETWETTVAGPVLFADLYDGETIDHRLPPPYAESNAYVWMPAERYDYPGEVTPRRSRPVRLLPNLTRRPVSAVLWRRIEEDGTDFGHIVPRWKRVGDDAGHATLYPGEHLLLDFGQNIVGRPRIRMDAAPGTEMTVRFAEMLNDSGRRDRGNDGPAGSLYLANYRTAKALLRLIAAGGSGEVLEPLHTFYGFRYLEIEVTEKTEILSVLGCALTADLAETGHVRTDNAECNRLCANIEWGRRGNYLHIPTDCPQRDERLGWSGDTQIFAGAAAYLADIRSFLQQWLRDARDSQESLDGAYGDVIPNVLGPENGGNAGWGDAGIIIPDVLYRMYGDTETMREHYASMERYMDFLARFGGDNGGRTFYGDWLAYEPTEKPYIALAYYANDAHLMAKYSRILTAKAGDFYAQRAAFYEALHRHLRGVFADRYVREGRLTETSQTAYLLALHFDLLDGEPRRNAVMALAQKIRENGYTLSTGFLGTGILLQTLSEVGLTDLAYSLLLQTRDPSWLYSVRHGATTIWERWNSYTRERGFGDVNMNSFNHYAYGAVAEWLFATAAGIRPDPEAPGFTHLILAPEPDLRRPEDIPEGQERLKRVSAVFDSLSGRIESTWKYVGDTFVYRCRIPQGKTATIRFPFVTDYAPDPTRTTVTISDVTFTAGQLCGKCEGAAMTFELAGGEYEIR